MRKRQFLALVLCALTVACEKDSMNTQNLIKGVSIKAETDLTRTTFDGEHSLWCEGDKLQVAIGVADREFSLAEFTCQTAEENYFFNETLTLDPDLTYNVYALHSKQNIQPNANSKTATVKVGSPTQQQVGASASHIALYDPLYGKMEGALYNNINVAMNHTAVALQINIENTLDEAISGIESLHIVAPSGVNLSGSRSIDFRQFTTSAVAGSNDSNELAINISSSGAIAKNETFTVWAAATPFTMEAGSTLNFRVTTTDDKVLVFSKTFTSQTKFSAGSIMQTTIAPVPSVQQITLQWGYLDRYTRPEGMPETTAGEISRVRNTIKQFYVGGYPITIDTECKFAYIPASGCIRFSEVSKDNVVYIDLPKISNYKLVGVKTHITQNSATAGRPIKVDIISADDANFQIDEMNTSRVTNSYDLSEKTSSQYQYSIYIYGTNTTGYNFDLTGIDLIYVLDR